jgi:flagellar protein FlbD
VIKLTKLNGEAFYLNVLLIERIESFPDTTITLISGKKYIVKDSQTEVVTKINELYKQFGFGKAFYFGGQENE